MNATYLSFHIGNEIYAVKTDNVLEVLQHQTITPIPNSPDYIKGIVNFRGEGIIVFDTHKQFNLEAKLDYKKAFIIIMDLHIDNEVIKAGAAVDKVENVLTIDSNEIQPVPPIQKQLNIEFIDGVVNHNNDFLLLLNMERVFTHDQEEYLKEIQNNS